MMIIDDWRINGDDERDTDIRSGLEGKHRSTKIYKIKKKKSNGRRRKKRSLVEYHDHITVMGESEESEIRERIRELFMCCITPRLAHV